MPCGGPHGSAFRDNIEVIYDIGGQHGSTANGQPATPFAMPFARNRRLRSLFALGRFTNMDISVHDNFLVSYEVLCGQREIWLHTEFRDKQPIESTDVIFRGAEAYRFYNDNFQTIIFDITEVSPDDILTENSTLFEEGRRYVWPGQWNDSDANCRAHFRECGVRGFSLSSSFGMCGWILAQSMERILRDGPPA